MIKLQKTQRKLKENEEQWKKNDEQDEEENNSEIRKTKLDKVKDRNHYQTKTR